MTFAEILLPPAKMWQDPSVLFFLPFPAPAPSVRATFIFSSSNPKFTYFCATFEKPCLKPSVEGHTDYKIGSN